MGSSIPYVSQKDTELLKSHDTVAAAYAKSIGKNSTEWGGKELRGFIDFLWKTAHLRQSQQAVVQARVRVRENTKTRRTCRKTSN